MFHSLIIVVRVRTELCLAIPNDNEIDIPF